MDHLKQNGFVIYLEATYNELKKRIANMKTRGIVMDKIKSFLDIYKERIPLYRKYAEFTISCNKKHIEKIVEEIILNLR